MKTKINYYNNFFSRFKNVIAAILITAVLTTLNSCQKKGLDLKVPSQNSVSLLTQTNLSSTANMVLTWNDAATVVITRMGVLGGNPLPPMPESRFYAMLNISMHDALNTIQPKYKRYILSDVVNNNASPGAAVAQAAHDVIVNQFPPQQGYADSLLNVSLNSIPDGTAKTQGINLGKSSAIAILNLRANDGSANAQYDLPQGTIPGQYRSTPPFDATGFMAVPGWGNITPFALASDSQYRPIPPYPVKSIAYATDVNELKRIGGAVSTVRTADQTQIALFWLPSAPLMFNNIARTLLAQNNITDAWKITRLLALVQIAEGDANIASLNAKYHYFFWRPYTAIHLADSDGNALTKADTTWQPLVFPTPPVPDYPSNHAVNGQAAAAVMVDYFQKNNFSFDVTSPNLSGVTRSFTSISQAARENGLSRIYVGYHFRNAVDKGQLQGAKIGDYIFGHVLQPL